MKITSDHLPQTLALSSANRSPQLAEPTQELLNDVSRIRAEIAETSKLAQINQAQAGDAEQNTVSFSGKQNIYVLERSEKTDQIESILNRVSPEQAEKLVDTGLIEDDEFIAFASKLDDQDLGKLADTLYALKTPSSENSITVEGAYGEQAAKEFINALSKLDSETLSRTLTVAANLSSKVPVINNPGATYDATGVIANGSPAANDIHNFVNAISNVDESSIEADTNKLLDSLVAADEAHASNLLQIFGGDLDAGLRLVDSLAEFDEDTQENVTSFLADLSRTAFRHDAPEPTPVGPNEWHGAVIDYNDSSREVVYGMIDSFISLTEDYSFSEDQVDDMADQLRHLDSTNQRAYLAITETGLDTLVGNDSEADLSQNEAVLTTLDNLRSDARVRTLVAESYMGEKKYSDGRAFYEIKETSTAVRDQQAAVELLTTHAWLNQDDPSSTQQLAGNLSQLDAEQRDQVIQDTNALSGTPFNLADIEQSALDEEFTDFLNKTAALSNTNEVEELVEYEANLDADLQNDFWQAASFAGEQVDELVAALAPLDRDSTVAILDSINAISSAVSDEVIEEEEATEQLDQLLDALTESTPETDES